MQSKPRQQRQRDGLYQRGNVWWMQFRLDGQKVHESTRQKDRTLAYEVMMQRKREILRKERDVARGKINTMPFSEAARIYELEKLKTMKSYQPSAARLGVLVDLIGDVEMHKINPSTFKVLKRQLRLRGIGDGSLNRYFSLANAVMSYVAEEHDVECLPKVTGAHLKLSAHRVRVISPDEEATVRDWFANYSPRSAEWTSRDITEIFDLFLATGMRRGELFSFKVGHIRNGAIILEDHKTSESAGERAVALNRTARDILAARIKRMGLSAGDRVFNYPVRSFTALWQRMRKAIGLQNDPDFVVHALRHTYASRLAQRGASIYSVSKLLGHSSVATTERYAHLFSDHLTATAELLDSDTVYAEGETSRRNHYSARVL